MNLPKPHPEHSEQKLESHSNQNQPEVDAGATPTSNEAERAPLRGVIERDLVDPNRAGTGQPDPHVVQGSNDEQAVSSHSHMPAAQNPTPTMSASNDNPALADDVDVIEKEWVDKAKQIIEDTKQDPYLQEQEVEKLQQDYMRKRYGKTIKSAE